MKIARTSSAWILLALVATPARTDDWPRFRGPNGSGVSAEGKPPLEFGPGKNQRWRTPVGSGHSSPCVAQGRVFLTALESEGDAASLAVIAIDATDGDVLWRERIATESIETGHPSFHPASSTPASDGERVVAYFGSYGLLCFDLDGDELWDIPMPLAKSYCGNATSPVISGDRVVLYRGNYVDHFVVAVDKRTGEELWRVPQAEPFTMDMACTATPLVAEGKLILHAARAVRALDLGSGEELWRARCATTATSSPILAGDRVIVATWNQTGEPSLVPRFPDYAELLEEHDADGDGRIEPGELPRLMYFHRAEGTDARENGYPLRFSHADSDESGTIEEAEWKALVAKRDASKAHHVPHGVLSIPLASDGELTDDEVRVLERKSIPEVPTPIHVDGTLYFVKNGGILTGLDLSTGTRLYRVRTGGRGTHYASPVATKDALYLTSGAGVVAVVSTGPEPEVLATNDLGERVYATPAIVGDTIYVRTFEALWAFSALDSPAADE